MKISAKLIICLQTLFLALCEVYGQSADKQINEIYPSIEQLYFHLHKNPELSFQEKNTSARLAEELRKTGFEVEENFGGFGLVGVYKNGNSPVILVRADMDALPVEELTELPYASKKKASLDGNEVNVMHACGHDVHMSVFIGTAKLLVMNKNKWNGTLLFIGQPAEERASGARAIIKNGLYQKYPVPDYALALHTNASIAAGKVGLTAGYCLANVDMADILVHGNGGHGAYPHTTIDPIVLSARIIMDLQTIVSREISPLEPAVVTVGSIHGGSKGNVIPDEVKLELTLRSYTDEVRTATIDKIQRILKGLGAAAGLPEEKYPEFILRDESTKALYNDPELVEAVRKVFINTLGEENVLEAKPVMGGEDFSEFGSTKDDVPILLFWLGTVDPEKIAKAKKGELSLPSLHSPYYTPQVETTIKTGIESMSAAVMELLKR